MPHSLRVRLGNLRYKKIISDKDYDRLCKALDNENILNKIRAEIEELKPNNPNFKGYFEQNVALNKVLEIIDKYREVSE